MTYSCTNGNKVWFHHFNLVYTCTCMCTYILSFHIDFQSGIYVYLCAHTYVVVVSGYEPSCTEGYSDWTSVRGLTKISSSQETKSSLK